MKKGRCRQHRSLSNIDCSGEQITYAVESPDTIKVRSSVKEVHLEAKITEHVQMVDTCKATSDHDGVAVLGHNDLNLVVRFERVMKRWMKSCS